MDHPPAIPANLMPLSRLGESEGGYVHFVSGNSDLIRHLAEIGLREGARLEMVRQGKTCILRIDGTKVCVRGDKLLQVIVGPPPAARHSA